ncbi:YopX family protein [Bacillus sp. FDAARGOS_1420]|uniref:YopX family protein n=1 Tax=unclassified Bacillus (in: firmicutes) TaxID=185979 RepID=UPI0015D47ECA|nr:YopX family protein [Bacillus sp. FDAARGOS_1420]MBW3492545.1 YopX family protein [Bacillus sp. FDAARGOS_1420]
MNTFKLKAYDNFEKKIYDIIEINFEKKEVIVSFRGGLRNRYNLEDVTIVPFIGLVDKNSNEIYERDLLKKDSEEYVITYDSINCTFIGINKWNENEYIKKLIALGFTVSGRNSH